MVNESIFVSVFFLEDFFENLSGAFFSSFVIDSLILHVSLHLAQRERQISFPVSLCRHPPSYSQPCLVLNGMDTKYVNKSDLNPSFCKRNYVMAISCASSSAAEDCTM